MNQRLTFIIVCDDHETGWELRSLINSNDRLHLLTSINQFEKAAAEVTRLSPLAAVIAMDRNQDSRFALIKRLALDCPNTAVICASRDSSSDLILRCIRAGAREFLRLPVSSDEFATVIERTAEFGASRAHETGKLGRTIAIFSSKGGCGNSFIAANLAAAMKSSTALVDLNLQAGDLDLYFGMQSKFSIIDLVENRARLDDSLLSGYMATYSPKLAILPAPRDTAAAEMITPDNVTEVMHVLRQRYDYIVIDPPHNLDSIALAALDSADDIVLVLTLDVASIRSAQRSIEIFDRLGYPRKKVRVLVNRWTKQVDMELQQVERFLGERVVAYVPNDYRAAVNSVNLGQPLVDSTPTSAIALEIKRVASMLSGEIQGNGSSGRGLLGIFRRQQQQTSSPRLDLNLTRA
jgi:pilus assembly protein CpaE